MWVTGLADFADDPSDARETWLEEIQREWVELC
jgi:FeS assembly protein IscX